MRMARIALTALLILLCAATAALAADFGMAVLRGGNTRDFWVYNIRQASWEYMPSTPHSVGPGGSITFFHTDGCVYALRGGGTRDFWRFTPAFAQPGGTWTELQPTPGPVLDGGSLTAVNFGGPSAQQGLYALQGGGSRAAWQWRDGTWTMIAELPQPVTAGGALATSNQGACLALPGGGSRSFCTYSFDFLTWNCGNTTPTPVSAGGALGGGFNGCVYGFAGGVTRVFFAGGPSCATYSPSRRADAPSAVGAGAGVAKAPALVGAPIDSVFALGGANTSNFWYYDTRTNAWHLLPITPAPVGDGGGLVGVVGFRGASQALPVANRSWESIKRTYR